MAFTFISADTTDALDVEHENFAQYNLYTYCFNNPVNMLDQDGAWPQWVKKAIVVTAVAAAVVAATAITVSTFGSGSIAGVSMISATATWAARVTEVVALQAKKSRKEGKSKRKIVKNVIEAVYNNGSRIIGKTAITKSASIGVNHALNVQVEKIFGSKISLGTTLRSSGGKIMPYGFTAYNWMNTIYSAFYKNSVKRANERRYVLK